MGNSCRFLHPIPCKNSERGAECRNLKYIFLYFRTSDIVLDAEGNRENETRGQKATREVCTDTHIGEPQKTPGDRESRICFYP